MRILICAVGFVFLFGCAAKENGENMSIQQAIINTQKARLAIRDNSTLLISATYLNNIKKYSENELDMIAISFFYSKKGDIEQLGEPKITIGQKAVIPTQLSEDDEIVKYLPFRAAWNKYFLASAPKSNEDGFVSLSVEIYPFERVLLRLPKAL
ncbi:MAG: hypothetical protein LBC08_04600 [Campylobacteraceae bacterium]|nr:hypothetical protein [Campylobacteraceae bacterium]